jgi:protein-tyrosine-phosphatase
MEEVGIDISDQRSKGVDEYLGKVLFQNLITVCDDADRKCPTVWPCVNHRMHWSFEDPAAFEGTDEEKLEKFIRFGSRSKPESSNGLQNRHNKKAENVLRLFI